MTYQRNSEKGLKLWNSVGIYQMRCQIPRIHLVRIPSQRMVLASYHKIKRQMKCPVYWPAQHCYVATLLQAFGSGCPKVQDILIIATRKEIHCEINHLRWCHFDISGSILTSTSAGNNPIAVISDSHASDVAHFWPHWEGLRDFLWTQGVRLYMQIDACVCMKCLSKRLR